MPAGVSSVSRQLVATSANGKPACAGGVRQPTAGSSPFGYDALSLPGGGYASIEAVVSGRGPRRDPTRQTNGVACCSLRRVDPLGRLVSCSRRGQCRRGRTGLGRGEIALATDVSPQFGVEVYLGGSEGKLGWGLDAWGRTYTGPRWVGLALGWRNLQDRFGVAFTSDGDGRGEPSDFGPAQPSASDWGSFPARPLACGSDDVEVGHLDDGMPAFAEIDRRGRGSVKSAVASKGFGWLISSRVEESGLGRRGGSSFATYFDFSAYPGQGARGRKHAPGSQ